MNKSEALIRGINFEDFKEQRSALLNAVAELSDNKVIVDGLEGIITLCDNIVDHAIDDLNLKVPLLSENDQTEYTIDIRGEGKKEDLVKELEEILATLKGDEPDGEGEYPNLFSSVFKTEGYEPKINRDKWDVSIRQDGEDDYTILFESEKAKKVAETIRTGGKFGSLKDDEFHLRGVVLMDWKQRLEENDLIVIDL